MRLAMLFGDEADQFIAVSLQQFAELHEDARTAQGRGIAPSGIGGARRHHRPVHVRLIRERCAPYDFTGCRIENVRGTRALAGL